MNNTTKDYVIQYGAKALDIKAPQQILLIALLHYRGLGKSNTCNPTRERLQLATGIKKLDDITAHAKSLEEKGIITRVIYTDEKTRFKRVQYQIHDDFILELCKRVEDEWYAKFGDDVDDQQAIVIADEFSTPEQVEKAISPAPKEAPKGKQYNPLTGKLVNESRPKQTAHFEPVNLTSIFTNHIEQSTQRYKEQNKRSVIEEDDDWLSMFS
jgi:hypothetical protein